MPGTVEWLPDAADTVTDLAVFGSESPMRKVTESVAFDDAWDADRRAKVQALFDGMAADWSGGHGSPERSAPIIDALDRGAMPGGRVVELGAGSGLGTAEIVTRYDNVIALDLSMAMLAEQPELAPLVQGDASALPFPDASIDVLVLVNMLLFPAEVDRVLTADGGLLWINTMGHETPIHLPADAVVEALPGQWHARAGRAGTGTWAAVTRA
ncbi:MAG: class I SAM-dependent methyltransferase [Actinomycetota bacterium]